MRPWLISMQRYCKLVSYYNENKLQGLQINVFSEWGVLDFEMFVVILQAEAVVLPACALNCVFYERAWQLLF